MSGPSGVASLHPHARALLGESMAWMDRYWDEAASLLFAPREPADPLGLDHADWHMVRDSTWYALGLLVRDGPGDLDRAVRILETVLDEQLDEPGRPYHGTFYRSPQEPHPPAEPVVWRDYDPNWREFVGTTLLLVLREREASLPRRLVRAMDEALATAVEGALTRALGPSYTNIALMNASLLCAAGDRLGRRAWVRRGEKRAQAVFRLFRRACTFPEYNSPTYYGVDLYALALWRGGPTTLLRDLGSEMEAALWREMAQLYHAGLRNLCGPYDRSYGMDMRRYAAMAGAWIGMVTGTARAPCPRPDETFAHASDLCFVPCVAVAGARVPPDAVPHFLSFQAERHVQRVISDSPRRLATAWLGPDRMLGAEWGNRGGRGGAPFHPATVHWRVGEDEVGWIRLVPSGPVDARASRDRIDISGTGELRFEICAPGLERERVQFGRWNLPGLSVELATRATAMQVDPDEGAGEPAASWPARVVVRYSGNGARSVACTLRTQGAP